MSLYKKYESDKSKEKDGCFIPFGDGVEFKLRRLGPSNKAYYVKFENLSKPFARQSKNGDLSPETALEIQVGAFCGTVLVDWKNVKDRDENPLEFSLENAKKLLLDLPDLYLDLVKEAENLENFLVADCEDIAKK